MRRDSHGDDDVFADVEGCLLRFREPRWWWDLRADLGGGLKWGAIIVGSVRRASMRWRWTERVRRAHIRMSKVYWEDDRLMMVGVDKVRVWSIRLRVRSGCDELLRNRIDSSGTYSIGSAVVCEFIAGWEFSKGTEK